MKKIIFILLSFFITLSSFGKSLSEASAEVEVYAEVLSPLEVETTPVNFGAIAQNSNRNTPKSEGTITIRGTQGANVKLIFTSSDRVWDASKGAVLVFLLPNGYSDFTDVSNTLYYYADILYDDNRLSSNSIVLGENGEMNLKVGGTLDAGNVIPGKYRGKFTVQVKYD